MDSTWEEHGQFAVLVVNSDQDQGQEICAAAQTLEMRTQLVNSHWQALALTEDEDWPCLIVTMKGLDVSGLEFCALLRAREARCRASAAYVILLSAPSDLASILSAEIVVDAYMFETWLDLELPWQLKRAQRYWHLSGRAPGALSDPATGLLTSEGLKSFLYEEVNRVGRQQGWFSLSLLGITDHGELRANFGTDWLAWFTSGVWDYLRRQLRNYDRLAVLGQGKLGLVSPDLNVDGTRALLARLRTAMDDYRFQDPAGPGKGLDFCAQYLCVQVLGDYKQFEHSGAVLWAWLRDQLRKPLSIGICGEFGHIGIELETEFLDE